MSLFDRIFSKNRVQLVGMQDWKTFNTYTPAFRNWNGRIYESELIRSAINARATHISKLKVEIHGEARPKLQTKLKHAPNEFQTWSQFLYRLSTILDVETTAFIVPVYDAFGDTNGIYCVRPSCCKLKSYKDVVYLQYEFSDGQKAAVELNACGIMTRYQYTHDFFGENNSALRSTMELVDLHNQAISEGIKSAASFRFMAQINNFAKNEDIAKAQKSWNKNNLSKDAGGGVVLFPNTFSNIQQISSKPFVVDSAQMQLIQTNVYNYFSVNEDVLQSKAIGDAWAAFYESVCESFAIQFSEVVTKMLFTPTERSYGAYVMATSNRLQYMSTTDKINYVQQMGDRGFLTVNEAREVFNLPPLDGDAGNKRSIRGEYYNADEKLAGDNTDEGEGNNGN